MGKLLNIAVRDASRAPMQSLQDAEITVSSGVAHDYRGTRENRQVTVLVREAWEAACADLGEDLPWTTRRANLLIEGVDLQESAGSHLCVGPVRLQITGETLPCSRMDEARQGLQAALAPAWRAGVTCRVLEGGTVRIGDPVRIEQPVSAR